MMTDDLEPDLAQRLSRHLRTQARGMHTLHTPLTSIRTRARRRSARRQAIRITGAVAATGLTTAAAIGYLSRDPNTSIDVGADSIPAGSSPGGLGPATPVTEVSDTVPAEVAPTSMLGSPNPASPADARLKTADIRIGESQLVWNALEVGTAEALTFTQYGGSINTADDSVSYVLATEPGHSDQPSPKLWQSADGIRWQPTGFDPSATSNLFSNQTLAADGGSIYGLATQPAPSGTTPKDIDLVLRKHDASTGQQVILDDILDVSAVRASPYVRSLTFNRGGIAVRGSTVVVSVQVSADVDWGAVDPRLVSSPNEGQSFQVDPARRVIDIFEPCVRNATCDTTAYEPNGAPPIAESIPFDELPTEIGDELWRQHLLVSTDGGLTFTEVAPPALPDSYQLGTVVRTTKGFLYTVTKENGGPPLTKMYESVDGLEWVPIADLPTRSDAGAGVGMVGERYVVRERSFDAIDAIDVQTADDGWHRVAVADLVKQARPDIAPLITQNVVALRDGSFTMVFSAGDDPIAAAGGQHLTTPLGYRLSLDSARGSFAVESPEGAVIPDASVDFELPRTGSYQLTVSIIRDGRRETLDSMEKPADVALPWEVLPANPATYVAHSTDGLTWSVTAIDDLLGAPPAGQEWYVRSVSAVGTKVIVRAEHRKPLEPGKFNPPVVGDTQTILVGTLKG